MIIVTNSKLVKGDFYKRIDELMVLKPSALILREKHLEDKEYYQMCEAVKKICDENKTIFYVHSNVEIAKQLNIKNLHISTTLLKENSLDLNFFENLSMPVHNYIQLGIAKEFSATSIIVGHIFETNCKQNLPPKGINFLKNIISKCDIPTNAIGGINLQNFKQVLSAGAKNICLMSSAMTWDIEKLKEFLIKP